MGISEKYIRTKPHLWNRNSVHTCYEGHDCEERWTVGHHLAEALQEISCLKERADGENIHYLCDCRNEIDSIIHHLRKAWDKSR